MASGQRRDSFSRPGSRGGTLDPMRLSRSQSAMGMSSGGSKPQNKEQLLRQFLEENGSAKTPSRQGVRGVLNEVRGAQFRIHSLEKHNQGDACEKCTELRRTLKVMKLRNDDIKRGNQEVQELAFRKSLEYEDSIQKLRDENVRLVGMLNEKPQGSQEDAAQMENLRKLIRSLEGELKYERDLSGKTREDLAHHKEEKLRMGQKMAKDSKEWAAERADLLSRIGALEESLHAKESSDSENESQIGALRKELRIAKAQKDAAQTACEKATLELEAEVTKSEELGQSLGRAESLLGEAVSAGEALRAKNKKMTKEMEELKTKLAALEKTLAADGAKGKDADARLADLAAKLAAAEEQVQGLAADVVEGKKQLGDLRRENEQEVTILEGKIRSETKSKAAAMAEASSLKRELDTLKAAMRQLKDANGVLQSEVEELTKKCETTKVVVVTPRIFITLPAGQAKEYGQMELPEAVIRKLVTQQLGYEPGEIRHVRDVSEVGDLKKK